MDKTFDNMFEINSDKISEWDKLCALKSLLHFFESSANIEDIGRYTSVDEKDFIEIVYLILKLSKGINTPFDSDFKMIGTKLTFQRMEKNLNEFTDEYVFYNGELSDLMLHFYMTVFISPFDDLLIKKFGFDSQVFNLFYLFIAKENLFNLDDLDEFINLLYPPDQSEYNGIAKGTLKKYIDYFTICESELNLTNFDFFKKQISKKPFILLDSGEYIVFFHFYRTVVFLNFHYLLNSNEEYKKYKGEIFEKLVADIIGFSLDDNVNVFSNVVYPGGEMDILVETSESLLIVECKSNILYDDYRNGSLSDRVSENIENIINKAESQLLRDSESIEKGLPLSIDGKLIEIDRSKEIIMLNACLEFPVGYANKDHDSLIITLSMADLIYIIDELKEPIISDNPRKMDLITYLKQRKLLNGSLTDNELTLLINILYSPNLNVLIDRKTILKVDSNKSLVTFNQLHSLLLQACYTDKDKDLIFVNYNGYFRDYVLGDYTPNK